MTIEHSLLLLAALMACLSLITLMRQRQIQLTEHLTNYVDRQINWTRKRSKTAAMAMNVALQSINEADAEPDGDKDD